MAQPDIALNDKELDAFFTKYFRYYTTLDAEWKLIFVRRVVKFIRSKLFVPQRGFELNNQVKAIISASAVQLTLGLKEWSIDYFNTIILFSSDFKNEISGLKLKGETNLNGFVSFSWKSFIDGYRIPDDNLNLGLHEFTHALRFNGVRGHESDEFFNGYFPKWLSYAKNEFSRLKKGQASIFRKYGGANINEFLSVVVEHFFESPEEFEKELPLFYSATAILLNQRTDGISTRIRIREEEIARQEALFTLSDAPAYRPRFIPFSSIFCFVLASFSALSAGLFSFPSLFLFMITVFLYLRSDHNYSYFTLSNGKVHINKGFFLFRGREDQNVSLPQIIMSDFSEDETSDENSLVLCYFNAEGFYEEELRYAMDPENRKRFMSELKRAFVWVK
jgi:MtfA peptidase